MTRCRIARPDPHDIRVGDTVEGNGPPRRAPQPGIVVEVNDRYVTIRKPHPGCPGRYRRVRVLRTAVWADGKSRATGYTVTREATP